MYSSKYCGYMKISLGCKAAIISISGSWDVPRNHWGLFVNLSK